MSVIGHQGPGIDPGFHVFGKIAQAPDKVLAIFVVINNSPLFNPTEDNMVEGSGSIKSRVTGHNRLLGDFLMSVFYHNYST
jgi:hypothetical protein